MLRDFYVDDLKYWTNWGGPNNRPRAISGRQEFIRHLASIRDSSDIIIRLVSIRLGGGQVRANFEVKWHDPPTGLRHVFTCRGIFTFVGERISRIEDFQDAPAMYAFAKLIADRGR